MEEKIGALWIKESRNGDEYMSGIIGGKKVVCFKNTRKKESKHPDWNVYFQKLREELPPKDEEMPF